MPSIVDLIGESVIGCGASDPGAATVPTGASFGDEGTVVGLYFAAGFDEASTAFTPLLVDFYEQKQRQLTTATNEGKASGEPHAARRFEIVFLSSDQNEESFREFLKEMPWHAVPFANVDIVVSSTAISNRH